MSSVGQLQAAISGLRSEINELQRENAQMEHEIQEMTQSIRNACNSVSSAQHDSVGALQAGITTIGNDDNILKNVSVIGKDIEHKVQLYKNIENAYKCIRKLNNDLRYHQGNEKTVRRVVTAMVENEEKMFASDETLRTQAEKLHLETKDFFLSYVMMEIQLRKDGEKSAADRALEQAEKFNPRKTAWVYYLMSLIRRDEKNAALWLDKIMKKPLVGAEKEFMKMLTLISLRDESENSRKIQHYIGLDALDNSIKDEIVRRILSSYMAASTIQPPSFQYMDKAVAEKDDLRWALKGAMNNENVLAYVQKLSAKNQESMRSDILMKMFDSVIETCHSSKAQDILDEIKSHEKVIEAHGVLEDAMANTAKASAYDVSDIKIEDCMFEWLNDKQQFNGKRELNELAFKTYRQSYISAYRRYVKNYRIKYTDKVTVTLGDYTTKTTLTSMDNERADITKFCQDRCAAQKSLINDKKFILFMVLGGLLTVAGIVLNFISALGGFAMPAMIICVLGGLVLMVAGVRTKYNNYQALIAADEKCARDITEYCEQMRRVYDDMQAYREVYAQYDATEVPDAAFV